MQNSVRTTIRIRKDLLDQSKLISLKRQTSLQETINQALALGFGHISDLDSQRQAMAKIDKFREKLTSQKFKTSEMIEQNKGELQNRADKLIASRDHS